jgi:hypothetical protein
MFQRISNERASTIATKIPTASISAAAERLAFVFARGWSGPNGFIHCLTDMGERPVATTLGRRGDVGDYCKSNCAASDSKSSRHPSRQIEFSELCGKCRAAKDHRPEPNDSTSDQNPQPAAKDTNAIANELVIRPADWEIELYCPEHGYFRVLAGNLIQPK